jgi:hypothetical protein
MLMLGLAGGGCTIEALTAGNAPPGTVTFESIDGPPPAVIEKLAQDLDRAAKARSLAVVARDAPAQYRVRGYLATHGERSGTAVAWVWDVYDAEQNRAMRISGREAGGHGARAWAAADESMLQHIADQGVAQLAELVGAPPGAAAPGPAGTTPAPDAGPQTAADAAAPEGTPLARRKAEVARASDQAGAAFALAGPAQ